MATPKKKTSPSKAGKRRSHQGLKKPSLSTCSNCKALIMPHRACIYCGYLKGKKIREVA